METYRRLFRYVQPYRTRMVWSVLCGILLSGTTALVALLVKPLLDQIFVDRDTARLLWFPGLIVLLYLVRGLLSFGHAYPMRAIGQSIIRDLRDQVFRHVQALPLGYLQQHHTGTWMSRIINDIALIERAVTTAVNDIIRQGLTLIGLVGVAFYRDWRLATYAVLVLPLASVLLVYVGRRLRVYNRRAQEQLERLSALLAEVFSSLPVVKSFGREAYEHARFQRRNAAYYDVIMQAARADELSAPVMECLGAVGVATVVWYGGNEVIAGHTTPGTFFSFLTAILMLYEPIRKFSRLNNVIQGSLAAAERTFSVLDRPSEWTDETAKPALPPIQHTLTFQQVSLRYQADGPLVLHDIDLTVPAGEVVALVGASGAGKTSLVHLIPRLYAPSGGVIRLDGVDIQQVTLASLRAQIAVVSQDVVLFDETLWQNIRYGHLHASDAQVQAAAQAAYAHEFIMQLQQGYETVIGERGVRLSGGEKQRIAIARAFLRNAPILILDEATSALDSAAEHVVQYALANLMKDRTTLVIAHRLSTVRHASTIVVLHAGTIVERGTHDELLAHAGYYRQLYALQFKSQE